MAIMRLVTLAVLLGLTAWFLSGPEASLPPLVRWVYDYRPEPGSAEARLYEGFLKPRDWLGLER